ncbi:hypothetical protein VT98_10305 [Candidatus Electrothrix communis]|uniref:Uncharacterized protein n=1 Tax=Candidatus Electrothrix communis TaxID=1859133 RepID=A0A444J943_9BACT|nr:hypothetical protein [Desulfobulbus sp. US4]RWX49583.1 hypothetical protein VT98_10305 [Candidatus Electrothrix communis]WLE96864.1 MAG: hypothetical protein QTN59_19570 [Candidatus Electrothrix communis]
MTSWSYEAFESTGSGRDGVTEMELRVTEKLEQLGLRAEYAKVVMTNIVEGAARAVVYFPDETLSLPVINKVGKWTKGDVNTIAHDRDTERYKEEMYQEINVLLNSLADMQAARSKISATAYKNGYSTISIWYPAEIS